MIINSSKSWVGRTQHQHCRVDFFPVIRPNLRVASLRIARSSTLMSYFKALWNQEEGNKSNKKKNCGHIFTFGIVIWARNKSTNWVLHHSSILKGKKVPVFFTVGYLRYCCALTVLKLYLYILFIKLICNFIRLEAVVFRNKTTQNVYHLKKLKKRKKEKNVFIGWDSNLPCQITSPKPYPLD